MPQPPRRDYVVWCAQVDDHVDKQFRELTQFFIHAQGISRYDKILKNDRLINKVYFHFTGPTYQMWLADLSARRGNIRGFLKTWFSYARRVEIAPIMPIDIQLFKCFSSFNRLDRETLNDEKPIHKFKIIYQEVNFGLSPLPESGSIVEIEIDDTEAIRAINTYNSLKKSSKQAKNSQKSKQQAETPDWLLKMKGSKNA